MITVDTKTMKEQQSTSKIKGAKPVDIKVDGTEMHFESRTAAIKHLYKVGLTRQQIVKTLGVRYQFVQQVTAK